MCTQSPDSIPRRVKARLSAAMARKNYRGIYKQLRLLPRPLPAETADGMLSAILSGGFSSGLFKAVLDLSPPLPEILSHNVRPLGLVELAAWKNRDDALSLLLERGASPNQAVSVWDTPLENALSGSALKTTELLISLPDLDTSWTDSLLRQWAEQGSAGPGLEACLRAIAPRFTGWDPLSGQPLPIPEPMPLKYIINAQNWPLMQRFCRERSVSPEDGCGALNVLYTLIVEKPGWLAKKPDLSDLISATVLLLESCPGLLQEDKDCRTLICCILGLGEAARTPLRPWVESLRSRRISMDSGVWYNLGYDVLPDLWRSLLPDGPTLVIDRWSHVFRFYRIQGPMQSDGCLSRILAFCPIRGSGQKGVLSPIAEDVLLCGDTALIESLFEQPDGLLATEDPDALIDFVQQSSLPRAVRGLVLTKVKKEEAYDL